MNYILICLHVTVNISNVRGRKEMKFLNDMNACVRTFEEGSRMVLLGDMNGK